MLGVRADCLQDDGRVRVAVFLLCDESERLWVTLLDKTLLQRFLVVFLGEVDGPGSDLRVSDHLRDVELPLADQIVRLEQVSVPGLHRQDEWLDSRRGHPEE